MELDLILKIVLLTIVILVLVIFVLYQKFKTKDQRAQELKKRANQAGFSFFSIEKFDFKTLLKDFNVLKRSEKKNTVTVFQTKNVIKGTVSGFDFLLFDFSSDYYTQNQKKANQTVIYVKINKDIAIPKFILRPKDFLETSKNVFGAKKLNLNLGTDFSKKYVLEGEEMKDAMNMFNFNKLNLFGNEMPEPIFESIGTSVVVFNIGVLSNPQDLKGFVKKAIELIIQFKKE